jgi:Sigma-70, region 4
MATTPAVGGNPLPAATRKCFVCKNEKPLTREFFYRRNDGYQYKCKICDNAGRTNRTEIRREGTEDGLTQTECARLLGITRARVAQIEAAALEKLRVGLIRAGLIQ